MSIFEFIIKVQRLQTDYLKKLFITIETNKDFVYIHINQCSWNVFYNWESTNKIKIKECYNNILNCIYKYDKERAN